MILGGPLGSQGGSLGIPGGSPLGIPGGPLGRLALGHGPMAPLSRLALWTRAHGPRAMGPGTRNEYNVNGIWGAPQAAPGPIYIYKLQPRLCIKQSQNSPFRVFFWFFYNLFQGPRIKKSIFQKKSIFSCFSPPEPLPRPPRWLF